MHSNSMLTPVESKVLRYIARKGVLESERAIAKALRLNHSTLNYVLRKFERERVIQGYKYRLDYRQVNLKQLAWVFISLKFNTLDVDEFIAHLFKLPTARLVFVVTGDYDLAFKVYARSAEDVVQFMLGVEKDLQQWISSSSIFFVNKAFKQHGLPVADLEKPCKLSPLDVRILGARLAEPDCSLSGLAARLKVHRNTVGARWNRLLSNKVVVKKTAAINPDYYWDAGVAFHSLILMDALPGKQEELARLAASLEQVQEVDLISAPHDLLVTVKVKDVNEYYEFLEGFYRHPEFSKLISKVKSLVVLRGRPRPGVYFYELNGFDAKPDKSA